MAGIALHGVLVRAYERFLEDRFGAALAGQVFASRGRPGARDTIADEVFFELVDHGAELAKREREQLLREFGAHLLGTLHELYPLHFPPAGARSFLLSLDKVAHPRIREQLAGAAPPDLEIEDPGGGKLRIRYRSPRQLCSLLAGMLDGTGAHYQTPVRHYQESCMLKGAQQCT